MARIISATLAWLTDPRSIFFVAAVFAALGLVGGYVEIHERADRELALRQGPPPKVALQEFAPVLHLGPADEVLIDAEAGFAQARVVVHPTDAGNRHALIVPLYPLSDAGKAIVEAGQDGNTALNAQVARRADAGPETPLALGFLVHPIASRSDAPEDAAVLAEEVFGSGRHGTVMTVNGRAGDTQGFGMMAVGAITAMEIDLSPHYLAIRPFAGGRVAMLSGRPTSNAYLIFVGAALIFGILGVVSALRAAREAEMIMQAFEDDDEDYEPQYEPKTPAGMATGRHPKFAPIPTQEEIIEAAEVEPPAEANWALNALVAFLRGIWIVVTVLVAAVAWAVRSVRNRPSHREDEAL